LTDSHQVHQRLAFQIVKEQYNDQLSPLPPHFVEMPKPDPCGNR
jgi:hypothetical protein